MKKGTMTCSFDPYPSGNFVGSVAGSGKHSPAVGSPLLPFVLGSRIGGSPDFDRFVVSHGR